ncbi:MAG: hypothetical protein ABFD69_03850 [Candidatus Sumerlaeia bacterium]
MIRKWMQYTSPLRDHEAAVLGEVYKAVIPENEFAIDRQIIRGVVKWHNKCEYQINLDIGKWAFPRLWDTPIIEGYDCRNLLLARFKLEVLFGLPIRLHVSAERPIIMSRIMPTPARLNIINANDFIRRPPLSEKYIEQLENKRGIRIPEDLKLFLTSNESAEYRHSINPLTEAELISPDQHVYYRILNGGGIHDLIIRLSRSGQPGDRLSKVFLVDYVKHEERFFAEGIREAVKIFAQIHREHIFH